MSELEKDVAYYSELVQREVWNQKSHFTCFDCLAKEWMCYPWNTKWWDWKCRRCWMEWKDIWMWHRNHDWIDEIRPHHIFLRCNKLWLERVFDFYIKIYTDKQYSKQWTYEIARDITKPYSWQSDEVKIELGKIVESVLASNQS